jgi:hypothetical protein
MKSSTIHHIRILFSIYLTASYLDQTGCTKIVYCDIQHTKPFTIRATYVYCNQLLINHQHYAQPFRVNMSYWSQIIWYWSSVLVSKNFGTVASRKQATSARSPLYFKLFTRQLTFNYHTRATIIWKEPLKMNKYSMCDFQLSNSYSNTHY